MDKKNFYCGDETYHGEQKCDFQCSVCNDPVPDIPLNDKPCIEVKKDVLTIEADYILRKKSDVIIAVDWESSRNINFNVKKIITGLELSSFKYKIKLAWQLIIYIFKK